MFLALDYTIGAFFWFIVGGIALISLTIFLARPESSSEKFKNLHHKQIIILKEIWLAVRATRKLQIMNQIQKTIVLNIAMQENQWILVILLD